MTFLRQLSPLEQSYLALDSLDESPMCNQYVLEGIGEISHLQWRSAIESSLEQNPGLAAKLKGRWFWRSWHDDGSVPALHEASKAQSLAWDGHSSEGAFFDGSKLDCREGKVAEIIVIPGDIVRLVFRTHHAVMDGNATLFWIRELFRALREESLLGSESHSNEMQFLPLKPSEAKQGLQGPWSPVLPSDPDYRFPAQENWSGRCLWQHVLFRERPVKVLPKAIAFLNGRVSGLGDAKAIFRIPADLRRLLDGNACYPLTNCVAALDMEVTKDEDANGIYRRLLQSLYKKQDLGVFPKRYRWGRYLGDAFFRLPDRHYIKLYQQQQCDISAIVTHVGQIKLADVSCDSFQASDVYATPVPLPGVSLSCVFIEHDAGLSLCMSLPKAYGNQDSLRALALDMQAFFENGDVQKNHGS